MNNINRFILLKRASYELKIHRPGNGLKWPLKSIISISKVISKRVGQRKSETLTTNPKGID